MERFKSKHRSKQRATKTQTAAELDNPFFIGSVVKWLQMLMPYWRLMSVSICAAKACNTAAAVPATYEKNEP